MWYAMGILVIIVVVLSYTCSKLLTKLSKEEVLNGALVKANDVLKEQLKIANSDVSADTAYDGIGDDA